MLIAGAAAAVVFAFGRGRQLSVTAHGLLIGPPYVIALGGITSACRLMKD